MNFHARAIAWGTIKENLDRRAKMLTVRVVHGLEAAARELHSISLGIVPRDTGALADSSHVHDNGANTLDTFEVYVGYGMEGFVKRAVGRDGYNVTRVPSTYAERVHEGWVRYTYLGGEPDFLRGPANACIVEIRAAFRGAL